MQGMGIFGTVLEQYRIIEQRHKFYRCHGYRLNLDDPRSYNEKIMWRKVFDRNPLFHILADKYASRSFVLETLGEEGRGILVPLLFVTEDPERIPFNDLPEEYIIKPNHGSGWSIIVDRDHPPQPGKIVSKCRKWLNKTYGRSKMEWAYSGITPRIMVEKLLKDRNGILTHDFKFYVFNGTTGMIYVLYDRLGKPSEAFYDRNFERLWINSRFEDGPEILEPEDFEGMLEISEKLAASLDFLRVDLYNVEGEIFFGEFTLYPASGLYRYEPVDFEKQLGGSWHLDHEHARDLIPWF